MKVLLISANQVVEPYPVYPLGLDYVAGALRDRHTVKILDLNLCGSDGELEAQVRRFAPEMVGISLRNVDNTDAFDPKAYHWEYRDLVLRIRSICSALIVLGGSGFTIFPERLIKILAADYGIVGEGERMAALIKAIETGEDPALLPGIVTPTTPVVDAPPLTGEHPLNFDPENGHVDFYLKNGGMLNLQSKRGCHFGCIYCTYPRIEGRRIRPIEPHKIAATALMLEQAGARYIFMTDSAFNADIDHSLAVAEAFGAAGLSIPWGAFFSPIELPHDYFSILAQNGLSHAEFGTESLSDPVLAAYGKPFFAAAVLNAHAMARAAGLHVAHYLLFGGPGETCATVDETLSRVDKLERSVLFLFCGMRIYPHTRLHRIACRQGQLSPGDDLMEPVFYHPVGLSLDDIAEMIRTRAKGRVNWVIGAGDPSSVGMLPLMYRKGYSGPLWEKLIR